MLPFLERALNFSLCFQVKVIMHFIRPRRFIKRRLVDGKRKYFFLPFAFGLFLLVSSLSGLISTCSLSSCPPSSHPESSATHQQKSLSFLSDLNGVEICLSIKFVEPIQPLELEGSPQLGEEGPYHVVYNYLKSSRFYGVNETVTYTTHSTPELMRNVGAVSERWDGPVSVAIYVPSTDFCRAMHLLIFLRNCDIAAYREKVTWHLFWPKDYPPPSSWRLVPDETQVDCDKLANDYRHNTDLKMTWRVANKLPYPINVGRNIARQASTTWFVLPSDVELYPSLSLAPQFISFISGYNTKAVPSKLTPSRVFVVPVFEVKKTMPNKKEELMIQLARRTAVYFHKLTCAHCQKFPAIQTWITNAGIPGRIQVRKLLLIGHDLNILFTL